MKRRVWNGMGLVPLAMILTATFAFAQMQGDHVKGEAIYKQQCASCHKNITKLSGGLDAGKFVDVLVAIQDGTNAKLGPMSMQKKIKAMDKQTLWDLSTHITAGSKQVKKAS